MKTITLGTIDSNHSAVAGLTAEQIEHYVRIGKAASCCEQIISIRPGDVYDAAGGGMADDCEFTAAAISQSGGCYEGVSIADILLHIYDDECIPEESSMPDLTESLDAMGMTHAQLKLQKPLSFSDIRSGAGVPLRYLIDTAELRTKYEQRFEAQRIRIKHDLIIRRAMISQAAQEEAKKLLAIWQSCLGHDYESCDDSGRKLWSRIESVLSNL
ncbi:hypothetical protein BI343_03150 [Chromobacterium amazonense]|uniref:hypothetical protein n=1 Tax=Chromobacterium amazonense TaxID=1382803 RepID=UPI0008D90687|nr:hypothetical protein [Chromobacterium amazonense]OHX15356.1 hypothetical protein BI343_03150 [Chromobacterium amazonense]